MSRVIWQAGWSLHFRYIERAGDRPVCIASFVSDNGDICDTGRARREGTMNTSMLRISSSRVLGIDRVHSVDPSMLSIV